jgi:general secretion pathway protein M
MKPPSTLADQLASLRLRWQSLAPRERLSISLASAVVALALFWWLLISPALTTLRSAEQQRTQLDQQLQQMRSLQAQAKALQNSPKVNTSDALRALEASVKQRLGATAQLNVVGDRASVTLKAASPDALAQWLSQARVNAHALPVEAHLVQSPEAGASKWSGTVVLHLP